MHFLCFLSHIPNLCVTDTHTRATRAHPPLLCVSECLFVCMMYMHASRGRSVVRALRCNFIFKIHTQKRHTHTRARADSVRKTMGKEGRSINLRYKRLKNMRFFSHELSFKEINRRQIRPDEFGTKRFSAAGIRNIPGTISCLPRFINFCRYKAT